MERQRTTKEDVGVGLEAHGETSRHCNIFCVRITLGWSSRTCIRWLSGEGGLRYLQIPLEPTVSGK